MATKLPIYRHAGFTLVEVLVAIGVLALLIALIAQLFNNTSTAASMSSSHLDSDARVRVLFARMAADFSQMVKRTDIDYYLKTPTITQSTPSGTNDQLAFYSEVAGYSSVTDAQNSVSLVAFRLNFTGTSPYVERLGTALSWGAGSTSIQPVVFSPSTIAATWPSATTIPVSSSTSDPAYDQNYEIIVPNAFRFEYYYLLRNGSLSATPWDTTTGHTAVNGLQDVAGIGVVIAVTDRKASALATTAQLRALGASMTDFTNGTRVGELQASWQATAMASSLPIAIKSGVRVYEQLFYLGNPSQ